MFGIKGRDTFNNPESGLEHAVSIVRQRWTRYFPILLGIIFLFLMALIVRMWYTYLYTKELTGEEKMQYVNQKKSEVVFRKEKFDQIKESVIKRAERFSAERTQYKDIFYR